MASNAEYKDDQMDDDASNNDAAEFNEGDQGWKGWRVGEGAGEEHPDDDGTTDDRTDDDPDAEPEEGEDAAPAHLGKPNNNDDEHAIIQCSTSAGPLKMHFHKSWSPNGYERATSLFERGYYDHSHFFRVVPHFLVQFGISYTTDTELKHFADTPVKDDPKRQDLMPFREGYVSFAGSGPNSRTSQLFIAYDRAQSLGTSPWETPFGEVVEGTQETVRKLYSGYGDMPPWGKGPQQGPIRNRGVSYIHGEFPLLDKFVTCTARRVASLSELSEEKIEALKKEKKEPVKTENKAQNIQRNVRGATNNQLISNDKANNAVAAKQAEQPLLKLVVLLGVVVIVILGLGIRRRKTRKTGKSV